MSRTKRNREFTLLGSPMASNACSEGEGHSPVTGQRSPEAEREVLLRLIPDEVFRIRVRRDGGVSVMDGRTGEHCAASRLMGADVQPGRETPVVGQTEMLCSELVRLGPDLVAKSQQSAEVQGCEIRVEHGGSAAYYEVRVAACKAQEVLAVVHNGQTSYREISGPEGANTDVMVLVRDVTARKDAEASMAKSRDELTHVNELLEKEASSHAEDEEVLESAFAKLSKLLENTVEAIQFIVQAKDPPTARHQARVCRLACAIGRNMGLEKGRVDTIGLAALLHDLGKVFIPGDTLNKPGRLTEDEFAAVKDSAETEFRVLRTIDLFYPIADIVHQHHERLNGSGYPLGLKGDEILLEARIIAVADVVEAMVSERPYRPALSVEAAVGEIEAGKGTLYDPGAVDACVRLFKGNGFEFDRSDMELSQEVAHLET